MYDNGGANGARKVHAPSEVMKAQTPGEGEGGGANRAHECPGRQRVIPPPGVLPSRRSSFPFLSSLLHRGQSARIAKREKGRASRFYIAPQKRSAICRSSESSSSSLSRFRFPPGSSRRGKGEGLHRLRSGDIFAFEIRRAAGRLDGRNNRREATRSTKPRYAGTLKRDVQRIFLSFSLSLPFSFRKVARNAHFMNFSDVESLAGALLCMRRRAARRGADGIHLVRISRPKLRGFSRALRPGHCVRGGGGEGFMERILPRPYNIHIYKLSCIMRRTRSMKRKERAIWKWPTCAPLLEKQKARGRERKSGKRNAEKEDME